MSGATVRLVLDLCRPQPGSGAPALEAAAQAAAALGAALELALLLEARLLRLAALPLAAELAWPQRRPRALSPARLQGLASRRERALWALAAELERRRGGSVRVARLEASWEEAGSGLGRGDLLLLHREALPVPGGGALGEAIAGSPAPVLLVRGLLPGAALARLPAALRGGAPAGPWLAVRPRSAVGRRWPEPPAVLVLPP